MKKNLTHADAQGAKAKHTKAKHTKGKIKIRISDTSEGERIYVEGKSHICDFGFNDPHGEYLPLATKMADANRMVKTWNMHDELIEFLNKISCNLGDREGERELTHSESLLLTIANRLLKQAEQK